MWHWFVETLRTYPEIAIFLALAAGFWFGNFRFGSFSLGVVTSTLLAGVVIGQLNIAISPNVKSTFFLMFLFAVGYGVGPSFFKGLKGDGIPQVLFAIMLCVVCLLSAVGVGKVMGYDVGVTAGLLSGASTISAVLGVATDSINQLSIPDAQKQAYINVMPVAYAVTYVYGTAGSAWFLAQVGPKLLRINLADECRKYEAEMGAGAPRDASGMSANIELISRTYQVTHPALIGKKVGELNLTTSAGRWFIERIRQDGQLIDAEVDTVIKPGAVIAVTAGRQTLIELENQIGPEVNDHELLDFEMEVLDVVITNKDIEGRTLGELVALDVKGVTRGVFCRKVTRAGAELPVNAGLKLQRGDTLTLVGAKRHIERAVNHIGYPDRVTEKSDMVVMGLGIAIGALIGAITFKAGGIPLSLSTSGGALIAGLICGWLRSVNRKFGAIPAPALWVFNNVGLNTFIAVVGIGAGPGFIDGIRTHGFELLLAGVVVTTVPFIVGIYAGKYVFKMKPPIVLGACAGARTTTAALGALEEEARSHVPSLGYTVTYAVGNTLLTIWGVVVVVLMA